MGLMNLAKHPSSTVQILGAEKALFRALKTKHDTPKYGLIYHAQLVGQSSTKLKGRCPVCSLPKLRWPLVLMPSVRTSQRNSAPNTAPNLNHDSACWSKEVWREYLALASKRPSLMFIKTRVKLDSTLLLLIQHCPQSVRMKSLRSLPRNDPKLKK